MAVVLRIVSAFDDRGIKAAQRGMARYGSDSKKYGHMAGAEWMRAGAVIGDMGAKFDRVGTSLTRNVTLPVVGASALAIRESIKFETAFAGVRKTVDATEAEFGKLSQGIRDMSKELPASAVEIAGVAEAAGQLGIETPNILGFTRVMVDLGESTNMAATDAATQLARLANITQMPQTEFDRLGSTVVALGNNLATTESEIVEMGLRLAGAGNIIGLTEDQILSMAGSLSSVGVEAQAGGTAFSKVFIQMAAAAGKGDEAIANLVKTAGAKNWESLQAAVAKGGDELEKYAKTAGMSGKELKDMVKSVSDGSTQLNQFAEISGMSGKEFQKAFQDDASGAITAFVQGLGQIHKSGGDVFGTLENLGITEVRMRDALLRSAGAGDLLAKSLDIGAQAWEKNTALTDEAAQRYETTESKLKILRNQAVDVGISLGDSLIPALTDALEAAEPLLGTISDLAQKFSDADPKTQRLGVSMLAMAAAAGPAFKIVGGGLKVVGGVATGIGNLQLAMSANAKYAPTWARAVVAGATGVKNLAVSVAQGTVNLVRSAAAWVADTARKAANTVATWASIAAQKAAAVGAKLWAAAQWALNVALNANPIGLVVIAIGLLVGAFVLAWKNSEKFRTIVTTAWNGIKAVTASVFGWAGTFVRNTWQTMKARTESIFNGVTAFFRRWGPFMLAALAGPVGLAVLTVVRNWDAIKAKTSSAFNSVKDTLSRIWNTIVGTVSETVGKIKNKFNGMVDDAKDIGGKIISKLATGIKNGVGKAIDKITGVVGDIIKAVKGALGFGKGDGPGYIGDAMGDGIGAMVKDYITGISPFSAGGGSTKGLTANARNAAASASRFGLRVSSGLRPGAITASGNPSLHGSGRAIDLVGTSAQKWAAFRYFTANASKYGLYEAINEHSLWKPGQGISRWARNDHMDHLHLGFRFAKGAYVKAASGGVFAMIGEGGDDEHVLNARTGIPILARQLTAELGRLGANRTSVTVAPGAVVIQLPSGSTPREARDLGHSAGRALLAELAMAARRR